MNKIKCLIISFACLLIKINTCAQNNKGFIPDSTSYTVLSQPSDNVKSANLVYSNVFKYPLLLVNDTLLLLSDNIKTPVYFTFPESVKQCKDAFIIDSVFFCKCNNIIRSYAGKVFQDVLIMPDNNFNIYPATSKYFYLVTNQNNQSAVYLVNMQTNGYLKLFDTPFIIDEIAGTGSECYIASQTLIYFVSEEIFTLIEVTDSNVQSLDFYEGGLFYSTEKACYYLGLPGKSYPFLLGNIKQLMLVDHHLYLLFNDGLLSVIDNPDGYRHLLDEVINEQNEKEDEIH